MQFKTIMRGNFGFQLHYVKNLEVNTHSYKINKLNIKLKIDLTLLGHAQA